MGKKVKEYKSGDFIFAKVKGYPAWPARVQRLNGKKYFVYFYGTGETANLPPNMIFDYAENKDKFLSKAVKRRDFNDGVKQIEYDFANNVPLEQVIGVPMEDVADGANDTANDSAIERTMDESMADTTANDTMANDTVADDTNATQNDGGVEDSDETGALVIDEGKAGVKGRKSKADVKTPAKPKEPKTPRGKGKKEESKEKDEKGDEELVSRSGRKIRPKRYIDEQTEENTTLPSPAPKRRRNASPVEKEKADSAKEKDSGKTEKTFTQFNAVKQSELEGLKEPFKPADEDKDNILIAYLPTGTYVGVKLFQARPTVFKSEASRLQWDKQAAANAITLKLQLERDQITPQSVQGQLVMDLNLTDEEKATLDKERETEEKKSRVNFLKTEMKLIELDAKIKTCLCLEKADTELCLKLLDELLTLEVKPLMLLKHPTCLETVKRMRAYVGNTPSWDLSESAALVFNKQAHKIRKKADMLYKSMKEHFQTPEGLSFWEYFSERVLIFKKVTSNLNAGELLEMVHEPLEMSQPNAHTMQSAIDKANSMEPPAPGSPEIEEKQSKKKTPVGKAKKSTATSTPVKSKRSTRNKKEDDAQEEPSEPQKQPEDNAEVTEKEAEAEKNSEEGDKEVNQEEEAEKTAEDTVQEPAETPKETSNDVEMAEAEKPAEAEENALEAPEKETEDAPKDNEMSESSEKSEKSEKSENNKDADKSKSEKSKDADKPEKRESLKRDRKKSKEDKNEQTDKGSKEEEAKKADKTPTKNAKEDKQSKDSEKNGADKKVKDDKSTKDSSKNGKESEKSAKDSEKSGKEKDDDKTESKDDKEIDEPRAKRSRDSKKTEPPPPRSPAKRKSKF